MSYDESIRHLYNLRKHGIKLGLDNIRRLLSELGNPHTAFRTVHVAGTNGKGSTSAATASILRSAGLATGLFTSPHLISFTERIRVNGTEIDEQDVVRLSEDVKNAASRIDGLSPTFFEVVTAMALLYFRMKRVGIAVMEVGMGGRLDATNIITPDACIITQIGYDHMEFLGSTLAEIAAEKAGIIKNAIPVVSACQEPEALDVISRTATDHKAKLYVYATDFSSRLRGEDIHGITFDYESADARIDGCRLPLPGAHQMQNASLAIKAACLILDRPDTRIIKEGLRNTQWPGRLELIHKHPPVLIDGAHNPGAAEALSKTIQNTFMQKYGRLILIVGAMADKDIAGILKPLLPLAGHVVLTRPSCARAASPEELRRIALSLGFPRVQTTSSVKVALEAAMQEARIQRTASPLILVTGSFYTIGEAKEALGQSGVLTTLRE